MNVRNWVVTLGIAGAAAGTAVGAHNGLNFGLYRDGLLDAHSVQVFGVVKPVEASSRESIDSTEANAPARAASEPGAIDCRTDPRWVARPCRGGQSRFQIGRCGCAVPRKTARTSFPLSPLRRRASVR